MYIHDLQLIRFHKQPDDTTKVNSTDGTTVIDKPLHETPTGINTGTPTPSTLSPNQNTMQPTEAPAPKKLRKTPPPLPKKEVEQAPPRHGQLELGPPARRRDENAPKNIEQPIQVAPTRRR